MVENTKEDLLDSQKIQGFGLSSFVYPITIACYLGMATNIIYSVSKVDSYISIVIGGILGIIPLLLTLYIIKNSNGEDILDLNINLFGKIGGSIFNIILIVFSILLSSLIVYNLTLFLDIQYIPHTNPLYVKILVMIPIVYAASKDIGAISRLSQMMLILGFVIFFITACGLIPNAQLENLQPVLSEGLKLPLKGGIICAIFSGLPLFFLTAIPTKYEEHGKNRNKKIVGVYILSMITIFVIIFVTTLSMGYGLISIHKYPEYTVIKNISILTVIERIDNTLAILFQFFMIVFVILLFYFIIRGFKKVFKNNESQQLFPYILGIIVVTISYNMFPNSMYAYEFIQKYVPYILGIVLGGSLLIISGTIFIKNLIERNKMKEYENSTTLT